MAVYTYAYMDTEGRVEYAQAVDADWQVPTAAVAVAVVIFAFVATLYSPSSQNQQGSVQSATDQLGQLRPSPSALQPSVDSIQPGATIPMDASGGLQAAGSADVYQQFEGGPSL